MQGLIETFADFERVHWNKVGEEWVAYRWQKEHLINSSCGYPFIISSFKLTKNNRHLSNFDRVMNIFNMTVEVVGNYVSLIILYLYGSSKLNHMFNFYFNTVRNGDRIPKNYRWFKPFHVSAQWNIFIKCLSEYNLWPDNVFYLAQKSSAPLNCR